MNFSGWVPMRRGILEHLLDGKLSSGEFAALTVLILLADKQTGRGRINGPMLQFYLPDLSIHAARRALASLEEKRYIFRDITPRSRELYPYWVNKYSPTAGPNRLRVISLSEAFETKDPKSIRYIEAASEGVTEGVTEGVSEGVTEGVSEGVREGVRNNDKDTENEKREEKKTDFSGIGTCDTIHSKNVTQVNTRHSTTMHILGPASEQNMTHPCSPDNHDNPVPSTTTQEIPPKFRDAPDVCLQAMRDLGLTYRKGEFRYRFGYMDYRVAEPKIENRIAEIINLRNSGMAQ